jgi:phosphate transport system substrate-binding protein
LGYAMANKLPYATLRNKAGVFVTPTLAATTSALAGALKTMAPTTDFRVSITNADGNDTYPICSMTYLLVHKTYTDEAKAQALLKFVWWAETEGQARAVPLGYAPLPTELRPWIEARLKTVMVNGKAAWSD